MIKTLFVKVITFILALNVFTFYISGVQAEDPKILKIVFVPASEKAMKVIMKVL